MIYLYLYIGGFLLLVIGYMIGVRDERKNGPAACQKEMDRQVAEYHQDLNEWDELAKTIEAAEIDFGPASKKIRQYGNLRLVK